jgi:NADH dehydrogenase FAD-containing subunit
MGADKQKILILGGGFAGIKAALELADSQDYNVSLLSEQENFRYYPTLYHTATGGSQAHSRQSQVAGAQN